MVGKRENGLTSAEATMKGLEIITSYWLYRPITRSIPSTIPHLPTYVQSYSPDSRFAGKADPPYSLSPSLSPSPSYIYGKDASTSGLAPVLLFPAGQFSIKASWLLLPQTRCVSPDVLGQDATFGPMTGLKWRTAILSWGWGGGQSWHGAWRLFIVCRSSRVSVVLLQWRPLYKSVLNAL